MESSSATNATEQKADNIVKLPRVIVIVISTGVFLALLILIRIFLIPKFDRIIPSSEKGSVSSGKPIVVLIANVTGQQATLFFVTEKVGNASVYVGGQRYFDDRGENVQDSIHQVTLTNLTPETEYLAKLCTNLSCIKDGPDWYGVTSGNEKVYNPRVLETNRLVEKGLAIRIKTGTDIDIGNVPVNLVSGNISGLGDTGILLLQVTDDEGDIVSNQLATYVSSGDGWLMDLANFRISDASSFYKVGDSDIINIKLYSDSGREIVKKDVIFGDYNEGKIHINVK